MTPERLAELDRMEWPKGRTAIAIAELLDEIQRLHTQIVELQGKAADLLERYNSGTEADKDAVALELREFFRALVESGVSR
jgi:hypothetical protein